VSSRLALFEHDRQAGIAKLAPTAYGRDGALIVSGEPLFGRSRDDSWTLLLLSGAKNDILPPEKKSD
jgi:hypothetical protein